MTVVRTVALLAAVAGLCLCAPPQCSYWRLWDFLHLTTDNSFVASVRPVRSFTTATRVLIDMIVFGILKVDEKSQTVQGHIWNTMSWRNEFVTWNPSDFCGMDVLTIPRSILWIPDIHIEEDASDSSSVYDSPFVNVYPSGWVYATFRQLLTFTCQINLNLFPFDDQSCSITFASMNSDSRAMILGTASNATQLTDASKAVIITQGEWELKNIKVRSDVDTTKNYGNMSQLIYTVTVSRRPMLYVINFIIPLFYFLILDLASFFINEARGEKLSFKVTILLSISVLLLILKDMLPSTETQLPMIANYCVGIFALVGISVLEAMAVSFLLSFEENVKEEPRQKNCDDDIQLKRTDSRDPLVLTVDGELSKPYPPPLSGSVECVLLRKILHELKCSKEDLRSVQQRRPRFKKLAYIVDSVFFVLYLVTVITFLVVMYNGWAKRYFE